MGSGYRTFTAGEVLTASNVQNYLQDQAVMVFAGTAARSSAIGTANFEEGMLTYLTDVDKLQVYTGATFADVYPAAASTQGLTLINTTSFSGVTTVNVNDVFSATYDNYKLKLWFFGASASGALSFRYRVGGADNSTSNYARQYLVAGSTAVSAARESGATSHILNNVQLNYHYADYEIFNPFATNFSTQHCTEYYRADQNQNSEYWVKGNIFQATTSFTGFSLISSGAAITGKLQVFGYNL
jgi:hypothetical protein